MNQLSGKTALVYGASSGIGLGVAQKLADEGAKVFCAARRECPDERITSVLTDVSKPGEAENAANGIGTTAGGIDVLVYSAGYSMAAPVEYAQETDWRYLFEVNFFGALRSIKAAIPHMVQNGGRILLISSLGGSLPIVFDTFYSCSKAALDMLAKSLRTELKPYNIFATALQPGGTATEFTFKRKVYPTQDIGDYAQRLQQAVSNLAHMEQSGMTPDAVAQAALKILKSDNPPIVSAAGFTNSCIKLSDKLLPLKLTAFLNAQQYQ